MTYPPNCACRCDEVARPSFARSGVARSAWSNDHSLARASVNRGSVISRSVSSASSSQPAEGSADCSSRPLPWLAARLEDAPYCCEPGWLAAPDLPSPARLLRGLNVDARLERYFQGKLRLVSCCSSLIRMCNKRRPLNPRIERATWTFQYIREMAQTGQASDRFSALTLLRILSVLTSNETFWPSARPPRPARSTALMCTNTSLPPSLGWIKPKPFWPLNHLTVPVGIFFSKEQSRGLRASSDSTGRMSSGRSPQAHSERHSG